MAQVTLCYKFVTGLRGFRVYSSEWTPVLEQKITFTKEENNPHGFRPPPPSILVFNNFFSKLESAFLTDKINARC